MDFVADLDDRSAILFFFEDIADKDRVCLREALAYGIIVRRDIAFHKALRISPVGNAVKKFKGMVFSEDLSVKDLPVERDDRSDVMNGFHPAFDLDRTYAGLFESRDIFEQGLVLTVEKIRSPIVLVNRAILARPGIVASTKPSASAKASSVIQITLVSGSSCQIVDVTMELNNFVNPLIL